MTAPTGFAPGSTTWVPGRGDYGTDHSTDLIGIVEQGNCVKGCLRSGTDDERAEFGPGGDCPVLAKVAWGDGKTPVPELDPQKSGPVCRARIAPPTDFEVATADMDPLFDLGPAK